MPQTQDDAAILAALRPIISRCRTDQTASRVPGKPSTWPKDGRLTKGMLQKHLNGGPYRGVCPIKAGDSHTMLALFDLDSHKGATPWPEMQAVGLQLFEALENAGCYPLAFRSSGGKGIHIYVFWGEPQDAYSVRQYMRGILAACGYADGCKGVADKQIEVFPKQDSVPAEGFGSMFILPLAGASEPLEPMSGLDPMGREYITQMAVRDSLPVPILLKPERPARAPGDMPADLKTLVDALAAIPNAGDQELDYDTWLAVCMAIHAENDGPDGLSLAHEFSARSSKYAAETLEYKWASFTAVKTGGVTVGTVYKLARAAGWQEDASDDFEALPPAVAGAPGQCITGTCPATLADDVPLPSFERNKHGVILATPGNLEMALGRPDFTGHQVAFDDFRAALMISPPGTVDQWREFADADYQSLRIDLARRSFEQVPHEAIRLAVQHHAHSCRIDSAILWLRSLKWDGVPRVNNFFTTYFNSEDSEYATAVSRYVWTASAGRVLVPGIQADMMAVLISGQGTGKTSSVSAMAPHIDHFCELSFDERDDNQSRKMRGKLIAEVAEMKGLQGRDEDAIKTFISRRVEEWTPKYKEFAIKFPRRLQLIGTINHEEFLSDITGNRRFCPLRVGEADPDRIARDRDQLWAEGATIFESLGNVDFAAAERLAAERHAGHMIRDEWESRVAAWLIAEELDGVCNGDRPDLQILHVAVEALCVPLAQCDKRVANRIGKILHVLGYENAFTRVDDKVQRCWRKRL